jgi:hypothetical protein
MVPLKRCEKCGGDLTRAVLNQHAEDDYFDILRECVECGSRWTEVYQNGQLVSIAPGAATQRYINWLKSKRDKMMDEVKELDAALKLLDSL